jgi:hypothetical protein
MSAAGNPLIKQAIIAGLTRFPRLELFGRYAAAMAGAFLVGYGACYVVMKGYYVPDKDMVSLITQVLVGIIISAVATKLGFSAQAKSEATVVANTIEAAATGQVPEVIAAKATPSQVAKMESSPATIVSAAPMPATKL